MTNIEAATWLTKLYGSYVNVKGHWDEAAEAVAMACMALKEKEKIMRSAPSYSVATGQHNKGTFNPAIGVEIE